MSEIISSDERDGETKQPRVSESERAGKAEQPTIVEYKQPR